MLAAVFWVQRRQATAVAKTVRPKRTLSFLRMPCGEIARIESEAALEAGGEFDQDEKDEDSAIALALLFVVLLLFPPS